MHLYFSHASLSQNVYKISGLFIIFCYTLILLTLRGRSIEKRNQMSYLVEGNIHDLE